MPTASDFVLRARPRGDVALLDAAEHVARDAHDWCVIAESFSSTDRGRAEHALSRALALAGDDLVAYRNVARIQRTRLADPAGAAHALATAGAMLLARSATTSEWCALAAAWTALGDDDTALDYLRHARAVADACEDYCRIGDLDRAEASARGVHDRIAIAKACDDAQDLDRLLANLDAAIEAIESVDGAIAVMRALDRFGASHEARVRCYATGTQYAASAADLLALSAIALDDGHALRCLDAARPLANANEQRRIAYRVRARQPAGDWPDDPARYTPGELLPWSARSLGWPHEPARLFDRLRTEVSGDALQTIASCDYGYELEQNLAALEDIVETGQLRHPLPWFPLEVLQLERWTDNLDMDHVAHGFACTVLLLDDSGPTPFTDGIESTISSHLRSCIVLGREYVEAAIGLYAAIANAHRDPLMRAFADLFLVLAAVWRDADDPRIPPLVARLVHDEAELRQQETVWGTNWLLGLTNFDQRHPQIRELAAAILGPAVLHAPHLAQLARLLA